MEVELTAVDLSERVGILSIDLEDWYQLRHRHTTGHYLRAQPQVVAQTETWLRWMEDRKIRATFFVLGTVAEGFPNLVQAIHRNGHEIASHGYAHHLTKDLTEAEFRLDVSKSIRVLEDITGDKVLGYRAPQFSIHHKEFDPLRVLAELGLAYDSSVFGIRIRGYGWADFPASATNIEWEDHKRIVEFPLCIWQTAALNIPVAGGGYFRVLPKGILRHALGRASTNPLMLYFHPYEVSEEPLRLTFMGLDAPLWTRLRMELPQNWGRGARLLRKLSEVVSDLSFLTCREVMNEIEHRTGEQGCRKVL